MVQLVGYHAWQSAARRHSSANEACDAGLVISDAQKSFAASVIVLALSRLSDGQMEYLDAMAALNADVVASGDVAARTDKSTSGASTLRASLIASGIIEKAGHGKLRFAIPHLKEWLREQGEQASKRLVVSKRSSYGKRASRTKPSLTNTPGKKPLPFQAPPPETELRSFAS